MEQEEEHKIYGTTALASLALSKTGKSQKTNGELINYIIASKDSFGTWHNTQATTLALKAILKYNSKVNIKDQKITVDLNGDKKEIEVKEDALGLYEVTYDNLGVENKLKIDMQKGKLQYEIVEEYYQNAQIAKDNSANNIEVVSNINTSCKVNDLVTQNVNVKNVSKDNIRNGMVEIAVPQGFTVQEESLSKLVKEGIVAKYEYNYSKIYLYLKDFESEKQINLSVNYRAGYPGKITGGNIRCYDYYNPEVEGISLPIEITINK